MTSKRNRTRIAARAALAALWLTTLAPAAWSLGPGEKAPEFTAPRLDRGGQVQLSDYRGKVVYLDFWASWCGPCLVSLPLLEEMRRDFPADEFQIVAVNLDTETAKAKRFLAKTRVGYPSATDPNGSIPERFGLETMPTSYLIDRSGVVRYVHAGFKKTDIEEIRGRVRDLVEEGR
ncbi:MAG: TlpA family protein disulfide reductase [Myxococcota bacterium]